MITVYEQRGIEQGIIRGKRDTLLRLTRKKFGAVPEGIVATIEAVSTEERLDVLLDRLVTAALL